MRSLPFSRPSRRDVLAALVAGALGAGGARASATVRPWPKNRAVPALDLTDLDGKRWTLAGLRGRPTLLNFWASWCEPCVVEMPSLSRLADEGKVRVLGVNYQEHDDKIKRFMAQVAVTFPVLLDRSGDAARAWTPRVFPSTVILGRDARPVTTVLGEYDWAGADAGKLLEPVLRG